MSLEDVKGALPHRKDRRKEQEEPAPPKELSTIWGERLDPERAWEEYPRPRMVREKYTPLNGYWDCCFTEKPTLPEQFGERILVPFSPESALSGVRRQLQPNEFLWYSRRVPMPEVETDERCLLHFEAVDQSALVCVDGQEVLRHTGGYLPFTADITDYLNRDKAEFTLSVRVQDLSDTSFHSRGKQKLHPGGMYYTAQSGIWQSVWMEIVPERYLEDVFFETEPDGRTMKGTILVNKTPRSAEKVSLRATVRIYEPTVSPETERELWPTAARPIRKECFEFVLSEEETAFSFELPVQNPQRWSPDTPWLYPAEVLMGRDRVRTYFAVRTFSVQQDGNGIARICLNGQPVFLNGVLDQGYWPDGLYTAPADEALVYDITQMKALGFNMLRKHAKIEIRRWYYHCDRLGMIVWQDMVNGGGDYSAMLLTYLPTGLCVPGPRMRRKRKERKPSAAKAPSLSERLEYHITARTDPEGREEFRRECGETVDLLRGYPCIMTWVLFNEGWGQFETVAMTDLVRRKDPGRLIDSASGWFEHKTGDFKSVHNYFRKLRATKDVRANVLSEYGGYVYHIEGHSMYESTYGYHTCSSAEEFEQSFHRLLTEDVLPLKEKGLCGAVYTQVSDIEEETNGLLTYDRKICKIR